ncbi:hypothetical protein SAMN04490357_6978 [Streptomyces misionensis]|uniref:Uncharacterized protein n=1 Tax=Streptomyces misionensis TaxID=67331 RepID=A0A1H5G8E0_9ACTN|nr:hypothetical protein SAMN04490357_6978 [Streptomyces misionensis]
MRPDSAPDFVGYLSTVSAYLQLPPSKRQQGYDAITEVLPESGVVAQRRAIAVHDTGGSSMVSTPSASVALGFADGVTRFCSARVFFA